MIKLVTQYRDSDYINNRFLPGKGWDGATGPWVFHIITGNNSNTKAKFGVRKNVRVDSWHGVHLTPFRLELVYD